MMSESNDPKAKAAGGIRPAERGEDAAGAASGEVVLFGAAWCGFCPQARAYLARSGISYRYVDIDTPAGKQAFAAVGGGGVPLLVAHGEQLRGFSELAYDYFFARHQ